MGRSACSPTALYRLISGMHSSITTSIIQNYYNETSGQWGPNMPFFRARFGSPAAQPYLDNLHFTLLYTLQAVLQAKPQLLSSELATGEPESDKTTHLMLEQLLAMRAPPSGPTAPAAETLPAAPASTPQEGLDFSVPQLQATLHNISRLMDCVGCEKCKVHGKLNILGLATAIRLHAVLNLLAKLSESVET
ncbi:endoplasmic reticulum oxidoreductin 1, partial [Haematococcus lacustris]